MSGPFDDDLPATPPDHLTMRARLRLALERELADELRAVHDEATLVQCPTCAAPIDVPCRFVSPRALVIQIGENQHPHRMPGFSDPEDGVRYAHTRRRDAVIRVAAKEWADRGRDKLHTLLALLIERGDTQPTERGLFLELDPSDDALTEAERRSRR